MKTSRKLKKLLADRLATLKQWKANMMALPL